MKNEFPRHLPPLADFSEVLVFPNSARKGSVMNGGPAWPNWEDQVWPRHCRNNKPVDLYPKTVESEVHRIREPVIWAGQAHSHFGHFIAEYSTRLLQSKNEKNDAKLLFGVMPNSIGRFSWATAPSFFREILKWFGGSQEKVYFCHQTLKVDKLSVAVQGEQMGKLPPIEQYLDLLDENVASHSMAPNVNGLIYVSRSRLLSNLGGHAAAKYLDEVLEVSGVKVIYPEFLPLHNQLEIYLGAERLIFSEGSALHCLQLLGRGLGDIYVINRRTGRNNSLHDIAGSQLRPRCKSYKNFAPIETLLCLYRPNGDPQVGLGLALYDVDQLHVDFGSMGVDIESKWDSAKYEIKRNRDILAWLKHNWAQSKRHLNREDQNRLLDQLTNANLSHLVGKATEILDT